MAQTISRIYSYTGVGNGKPIIVPDNFFRLNVELTPVGGSSKIQHTIYPFAEGDNPDDIEWNDWKYGDISSKKQARLIGAATAFRVVNVDATSSKLVVNFKT